MIAPFPECAFLFFELVWIGLDYQGMKGFRARMAGQITVYLNPFQARSSSICESSFRSVPFGQSDYNMGMKLIAIRIINKL